MTEFIWLVDGNDNVLGKIKRNECHQKKLIHRSIVILVFNHKDELWVNNRSRKKEIFGGCLDSSVSSHVEYGETPEKCAQRELNEELGLKESVDFIFKIKILDNIDNMFVYVFKCVTNECPKIDRAEIESGSFASLESIKEMTSSNPTTPWFKEALKRYIEMVHEYSLSTRQKRLKPTVFHKTLPRPRQW